MLLICTFRPRIKVKVVVRLNPIILLNRQGSLGLWGHVPSGKYKYYNFFCFNCFIKYKNFSQKVMIELWSYVLVGVVVSILHCDILEGLVLALSMAILFHLPES